MIDSIKRLILQHAVIMFLHVLLPWQTRDALKKFMDSLIAKVGKLRSLVRDLESKYDDPAAQSSMSQF